MYLSGVVEYITISGINFIVDLFMVEEGSTTIFLINKHSSRLEWKHKKEED